VDTGLFAGRAGFAVLDGTLAFNGPVVFKNCIAVDTQIVKTMQNGFFGDATTNAQAIDCLSQGAVVQAYNGVRVGGVHTSAQATVSQSVSTSSIKIAYNAVLSQSDEGSFIPAENRILIQTAGTYFYQVALRFGGSIRGMTIYIAKNGSYAARHVSIAQEQHNISGMLVDLKPGDYLEVFGQLDAGGSLSLTTSNDLTYFNAVRI
jgi:hypothetical protein